jgi:hypothetical protein
VGWFFGILFILFGLLLVFGLSPIAGLIVMFLGVLMCYGGNRSGRETTIPGPAPPFDRSGDMPNIQGMEEERRKEEVNFVNPISDDQQREQEQRMHMMHALDRQREHMMEQSRRANEAAQERAKEASRKALEHHHKHHQEARRHRF